MDVSKSTFIKSIDDFLNELELAFEYIKTVPDIHKYMKNTDTEHLADTVYSELQPIEAELIQLSTRAKMKLDFLDNVVLFNGLLEFRSFSQENKSTKRTLGVHLYQILMTCVLYRVSLDPNKSALEHVSQFIQSQVEPQPQPQPVQGPSSSSGRKKRQTMPPEGDLFGKLFENGSIMKIAGDLTKSLENEKIDPMVMLNSLLSGKPNGKVQNVINKLTSTIEEKINSGELDKKVLEQQASNIMSTVENSDIFGNLSKQFRPK